jgi:hypothetical protein
MSVSINSGNAVESMRGSKQALLAAVVVLVAVLAAAWLSSDRPAPEIVARASLGYLDMASRPTTVYATAPVSAAVGYPDMAARPSTMYPGIATAPDPASAGYPDPAAVPPTGATQGVEPVRHYTWVPAHADGCGSIPTSIVGLPTAC